jgi:hypothetical protein
MAWPLNAGSAIPSYFEPRAVYCCPTLPSCTTLKRKSGRRQKPACCLVQTTSNMVSPEDTKCVKLKCLL